MLLSEILPGTKQVNQQIVLYDTRGIRTMVYGVTFENCTFVNTAYNFIFINCSFQYCIFQDCDLYNCEFDACDLIGLQLTGVRVEDCDMSTSKLSNLQISNVTSKRTIWDTSVTNKFDIIPRDGKPLTGWKKCKGIAVAGGITEIIVELEIPPDALVSNAFGRKCRASKALVKNFITPVPVKRVVSIYDTYFDYTVGEIVTPVCEFDTNPATECASGIHFFLTRREAEAW